MQHKLFSNRFTVGMLITSATLFLSYFWYDAQVDMKQKSLDLDERMDTIAHAIIGRVQTIDKLYASAERYYDRDLIKILERMKSEYILTGSPPKALYKFIESTDFEDASLDVYVIDAGLKVINTTKEKDMNLDLGKDEALAAYLRDLLPTKDFSSPRVKYNLFKDSLLKYSYLPSGDGKFIFEVSTDLGKFADLFVDDSFDSVESTMISSDSSILSIDIRDYSTMSYKDQQQLDTNIDKDRISAIRDTYANHLPQRVIRNNGDNITTYVYSPYNMLGMQPDRTWSESTIVIELIYTDSFIRNETRNRLFIEISVTILILAILTFALLIYNRRFVHPLQIVLETIENVQSGNMAARSQVKSANEVGILSDNLNDMLDHIDMLIRHNDNMNATRMRSLNSMVSGVAHEMNTPIGVCITAASYMHELSEELKDASKKCPSPETDDILLSVEESSMIILSNLARTAHLIEQFKKISVDSTYSEPSEFIFDDLIDIIISGLSTQISTLPILIERMYSQNMQMKSHLPDMIQIFTQLIKNSIEHGFDGTNPLNIRITAIDTSDSYHIVYSDDGVGLHHDNMDINVFEPFVSTAHASGHAGLGLSIVYNIIIDRLKGSIRMTNSSEENGLTFEIHLPKVT